MATVNYTNLQILDFALEYLHSVMGESDRYITQEELVKNMQGAFIQDINMICHKLCKDGYLLSSFLEYHTTHVTNNPDYVDYADVKLSFDGKTFIEKGGYQGKAKRKSDKRKLENEFRTRSEKNAKRLNTLTGWLAFGAISLSIIEIIKLFLCK